MNEEKKTQAEELRAVLKKHMPEQVGAVLRERLDEADQMEKKIEELERSLEYTRGKNRELEDNSKRTYELDEGEKQLKADQEKLKEEQSALEVETLQIQLGAANDKLAFCKELNLSLTRNVEFRRHFFGDVASGTRSPEKDQWDNGQASYPETVTVDQTTQETTE
jgi:hypothetical protein